VTEGLGAGSKLEIGKAAAEETLEEICDCLMLDPILRRREIARQELAVPAEFGGGNFESSCELWGCGELHQRKSALA
jgi:hypothetical protein